MILRFIAEGFIIKLVTGFDDTLTRIPILTGLTKKMKGRIAFSIGVFSAITIAIILSVLLASVLKTIPYTRPITATILILLAIAVYTGVLDTKRTQKQQEKAKKAKHETRFIVLVATGFLATLVTVIDDALAYTSVFIESPEAIAYGILGIYLATLLQLTLAIYAAHYLAKIPHKKTITATLLIVLAVLVALGVW